MRHFADGMLAPAKGGLVSAAPEKETMGNKTSALSPTIADELVA